MSAKQTSVFAILFLSALCSLMAGKLLAAFAFALSAGFFRSASRAVRRLKPETGGCCDCIHDELGRCVDSRSRAARKDGGNGRIALS